jgi:hypothetical protein
MGNTRKHPVLELIAHVILGNIPHRGGRLGDTGRSTNETYENSHSTPEITTFQV